MQQTGNFESWDSRRSNMPIFQESRAGVEDAVAWNSYPGEASPPTTSQQWGESPLAPALPPTSSQQCRQSSYMGNSQNMQAMPPTTSGQYKQGITIKVPRGKFGPPRTTMDGGALFETADRDRDGILTQNEAHTAVNAVSWQQSVAMSQSNLSALQSYRDYEAGRSGGSADYNPFTSGGPLMRSSFRSASPRSMPRATMGSMHQESPTPPGSAAALGNYAMPLATSGGYGRSYGGGSMQSTTAAAGFCSGTATPPTPPAPWGSSSYDQSYRAPVTAY